MSAVSLTSSCDSGFLLMPAARFDMQLIPQMRSPAWLPAIASHAVLIPTASAPRVEYIRISAGDS